MTKNFEFCNAQFLPFFSDRRYSFYNQFYNRDLTLELLNSIGELPNCKVEFRYNDEKRIRATFIIFEDPLEDQDVKCICTLFHGHRFDYHCYFYDVFKGDNIIGCVEVASNNTEDRIGRYLDAGTNIDDYFQKLCSFFDAPNHEDIAMLFYNEVDDCFRILDINPSDLKIRSSVLLGSKPIKACETYEGVDFIFFKSTIDNSYLVARTNDGQNLVNAFLSDIEILKNK